LPALSSIIFIFYLILKVEANVFIIVFYFGLLLVINIIIYSRREILFPEVNKLDRYKNLFLWYSSNEFYLCLISWLSLLVIIPVLFFSVIFFNNALTSDLKYNLFSYAKRNSDRNYEINKYYDQYVSSSFQEYKDSSK